MITELILWETGKNLCLFLLQARHQGGINDPLLLEEILDETKQLDITSKMRHLLATEVREAHV